MIDTELKTLSVEEEGGLRQIDLYSNEAFSLLSQQWPEK